VSAPTAEATETTAAPRLKQKYDDTVKAALKDQLGLGNVMQVPRLEKIVINMGVGKATQQPSLLEGAVRDMTAIAGQKPIVTKARDSIAGVQAPRGPAIGCKVTLRGDRAWEFLDRLVSVAIPASVTSAACRRTAGTAVATTRSASPSRRSSRRSTTTRSTLLAAWTSRSSPPATTNEQGRALLDAFGFPFQRAGDPQSALTPKKPKRRGPAFSGKKKK
jgi:large subunit ribosomal protein L5